MNETLEKWLHDIVPNSKRIELEEIIATIKRNEEYREKMIRDTWRDE